jgi:chemosensory pili system protein ChpA (sensor histidine kinase/response regulator)
VILALLQQELHESAPTLAVLQPWAQGEALSDEAFDAVLEFLDRFAHAVQASGLDGLAEYLGLVRLLLAQCQEDPGRENAATERSHVASWPHAAALYLKEPGSAHAAEAIEYSLAGSTATVDLAWQKELIERLLDAPAVSDASDALTERDTAEDPQDYVLDVAEVEPDQLQVFLFDAPRQVLEVEAAISAWGAGICTLPQMQEAMRAAHTLKGSGYILGLRGIGRLSHHLEDVLECGVNAVPHGAILPRAFLTTLLRAVDALQQMAGFLQGQETPPPDVHLLGEEVRLAARMLHAGGDGALPDSANDGDTVGQTPPTTPSAPVPTTTPAQQAPLQLDSAHMDVLLRRSGQSMSRNARLVELARGEDTWLQALASGNRDLLGSIAELAELVKSQSFQVHETMRARGDFDPLELDRYDSLQNRVLSMEEKARDQQVFLTQAKAISAQLENQLREGGVALADQRQDLLKVRATTVKTIAARLRRTVAQTAEATGRKVQFILHGDHVRVDGMVLQKLVEALLHVLRNAVDHGIESPAERLAAGKPQAGLVEVQFSRNADRVTVSVRDDGRGLDSADIRQTAMSNGLLSADSVVEEQALFNLILLPGFSTRERVTQTSGRGVGLDVVNDRLRQLQGDLQIHSVLGQGCVFQMSVQANSGVVHAVLMACGDGIFAVPSDAIEAIIPASEAAYSVATDGQTLLQHADKWLPVGVLADWLQIESNVAADRRVPVIVRILGRPVALLADAVLDARELILQGVGRLVRHVGGLSSAALTPDGKAIFLLDLPALQRDTDRSSARQGSRRMQQRARIAPARLLVVDDAWAVRMTMKQLLEDAGYRVDMAHNGSAALDSLRQSPPDLVITDLEMPELNGLELAWRMRSFPAWADLPLIMVTSRSADKHRQAAMEAGVQLYLTKPYRDSDLLAHVRAMLAPKAGTDASATPGKDVSDPTPATQAA